MYTKYKPSWCLNKLFTISTIQMLKVLGLVQHNTCTDPITVPGFFHWSGFNIYNDKKINVIVKDYYTDTKIVVWHFEKGLLDLTGYGYYMYLIHAYGTTYVAISIVYSYGW